MSIDYNCPIDVNLAVSHKKKFKALDDIIMARDFFLKLPQTKVNRQTALYYDKLYNEAVRNHSYGLGVCERDYDPDVADNNEVNADQIIDPDRVIFDPAGFGDTDSEFITDNGRVGEAFQALFKVFPYYEFWSMVFYYTVNGRFVSLLEDNRSLGEKYPDLPINSGHRASQKADVKGYYVVLTSRETKYCFRFFDNYLFFTFGAKTYAMNIGRLFDFLNHQSWQYVAIVNKCKTAYLEDDGDQITIQVPSIYTEDDNDYDKIGVHYCADFDFNYTSNVKRGDAVSLLYYVTRADMDSDHPISDGDNIYKDVNSVDGMKLMFKDPQNYAQKVRNMQTASDVASDFLSMAADILSLRAQKGFSNKGGSPGSNGPLALAGPSIATALYPDAMNTGSSLALANSGTVNMAKASGKAALAGLAVSLGAAGLDSLQKRFTRDQINKVMQDTGYMFEFDGPLAMVADIDNTGGCIWYPYDMQFTGDRDLGRDYVVAKTDTPDGGIYG